MVPHANPFSRSVAEYRALERVRNVRGEAACDSVRMCQAYCWKHLQAMRVGEAGPIPALTRNGRFILESSRMNEPECPPRGVRHPFVVVYEPEVQREHCPRIPYTWWVFSQDSHSWL